MALGGPGAAGGEGHAPGLVVLAVAHLPPPGAVETRAAVV